MSQAWFDKLAADRHEARSAGTEPAEHVHANVVTVMGEDGLDLRQRAPRLLTDELSRWADVVVTMGCGDACPVPLGRRYLDWPVPDPAHAGIDQVRAIRDEIAERITELLTELGVSP